MTWYNMNIKVSQIIKHDIRKSFKPLPKSVGSTWHREAAKRWQLRAAGNCLEDFMRNFPLVHNSPPYSLYSMLNALRSSSKMHVVC